MKTMKKISKKLVIGGCAGAVALGLVFASGIGSTAQAIAPPDLEGGCPSGDTWVPMLLVELLNNNQVAYVGNARDQNDDGWVCVRENKGLTAKNDVLTYVVKDNTNKLPPSD